MSSISPTELGQVRAQFPALSSSSSDAYIYSENAGGSQVLGTVAASISRYLLSSNVQMGSYALAQHAESRVSRGTSAAAALLGAESPDNVMIGQSATSLVASVAGMIVERGEWNEGEVVVSDADHETNRGAWVRLAKRLGLEVRDWPVTSIHGQEYEVTLDSEALKTVLTPKTKLVAFTACSNLLGAYTNISSTVATVRSIAPEAVIVVDCVAFAPHRRLLPREWGVDIAFFSLYKTYGAHVGAMYLSKRVKESHLAKMNHFFLTQGTAMYSYQTSSVQYELNYSIAAVADYLVALGRGRVGENVEVDWNAVFGRSSVLDTGLVDMSRAEVDSALDRAFAKIAAQEATLLAKLIPFLLGYTAQGVRIIGPTSSSATDRAPTVAFVVVDPSTHRHRIGTSRRIHTSLVQGGKLGAQQGHMYAYKLVQSLGLDLEDGVVRLSLVHYNTVEEVERIVALLKSVLDEVL